MGLMKHFEKALELKLAAQNTRKYWNMARTMGISASAAVWEQRKGRKEGDTTWKLYLERYMDYTLDTLENPELVFAVFDEDGEMVLAEGSKTILKEMGQHRIVTGVNWGLRKVGPNAVSVGLEEHIPVISVGEENYNEGLQNYAIYFSPVIVHDVRPPFDARLLCGIAIVVPKEKQSVNYQMLASASALHTISDLHHYRRHYLRYSMSDCGVLTVDLLKRDRPVIRHADQPLFDILEIKEDDYQGKALTELIDPLPYNAKFWDVLDSRKEGKDMEVTLCVQGKRVDCMISTDSYYQPAIEVEGMHFFITTSKWVAGRISDKIGNNALRGFDTIVGNSSTVKSAIARGKLIANTDSNIIILGESGTGKDVFAQAIHNSGKRKGKPFIAVNCGALSRDLIASELFGYEGGSFTGAKKQGNIGKFELANGGTLFLDEIGELPMDMQATLLRAVEQKKIMHIGGTKEIEVDVRIISATNADLPGMIENKLFREDLYYRLSTFELCLPPLREREDDVVLLAEYFARKACAKCGRTDVVSLLPETQELLKTLPWRGNVRELQNLIEGIVQLYPDTQITPEHIYTNMRSVTGYRPASSFHVDTLVPERITRQGKKADISRLDIERALESCGQNRSEAAEKLGIARKTLYRYIKKFGME